MEFNHDHLQENRKYTAPEKLIGLEYLSLTPAVIERERTSSKTLTEFLGEKMGQFVQAPRQVGLRSCLVTNRFKIGPFRELKRLHEAIVSLRVDDGN
jgi:hypothetical protein